MTALLQTLSKTFELVITIYFSILIFSFTIWWRLDFIVQSFTFQQSLQDQRNIMLLEKTTYNSILTISYKTQNTVLKAT